MLTWGMLPLHASGICACTQHFFGNAASLDWLVAAQGAFTMMGNVGMCVAAGELAKGHTTSGEAARDARLAFRAPRAWSWTRTESSWWDFDVENFGTKLWAEDEDGVFITKVADSFLSRRFGRTRVEFSAVAGVRCGRRAAARLHQRRSVSHGGGAARVEHRKMEKSRARRVDARCVGARCTRLRWRAAAGVVG